MGQNYIADMLIGKEQKASNEQVELLRTSVLELLRTSVPPAIPGMQTQRKCVPPLYPPRYSIAAVIKQATVHCSRAKLKLSDRTVGRKQ
jgi:hypothetical protein